ncbi:Na+/H+ antiporter NhaC [Kiloniella sp. b19]|uniref:Na+/H+ antiporter NhaC n=1 Tax=Kiloniella sp. GXU_MW_B19 TaxID=3141326 RepID=UPI0031D079D4
MERTPSLPMALLPILATLAFLIVQLFYFGDFTPHIPIVMGITVTGIVGYLHGYKWQDIQEGIFHVISVALPSVSILLIVGMAVGVWIASGTVPSMIYYGLGLIDPAFFLATAMLLCAFVSVSLGTSWGTVGTVGLALMGIGSGFDIPAYWTAGAVVSGAFFGDKISPLSDTTNLAPAVSGVDLFDHIRNLLPTTIPAMLIALAIYVVAGFSVAGEGALSSEKIAGMTTGLEENFNISPVTLLPLLLVIVLAVRKMPAIPSLFAGVVLGGLIALFQGVGLHDIWTYAHSGYKIETSVSELDSLLNRGGVMSMTWLITLVLFALGLGGALERTKCLQVILQVIVSGIRSFAGLQIFSTFSSILTNAISGDVYLSITLPGRMFAPAYRGIRYSTKNLSRALEEGGTLISPLIPWNVGGAFVISALGLGIVDGTNLENLWYIPLAFACWISPLLGIVYALLGKFSPKASEEEVAQWHEKGEEIFETGLSDRK